MSTLTTPDRAAPPPPRSPSPPPATTGRLAQPRRRRVGPARVALHVVLASAALAWLVPFAWAVFTSLRPFEETARNGYVSWPESLTLTNYSDAFVQGDLARYFLNTVIIVLPALAITLFLASMAAFVLSRFSFRGNLLMLLVFTAGNLLPNQVIITPLFQVFRQVPLPSWMSDSGTMLDSYWAVGVMHVSFQLGFCIFVLSNFMKVIPKEMTEAAVVDGASVWRQYWNVILPLSRPPLAALGTLMFTWMYNDFFWALVLMVSGDKRPVTSALDNLSGTFFTNNNLVAAASVLIALPTILVYVFLQKQFVSGLTMGATKG